MLRIDSVLAAVLAVGRPGLLQAAFNCFCQSYTAAVNCSADRSTFSPPLTTAVNRQLSRHSADPGHHVGRNSHLESDPAFAGELPAPKRPRCGVARNRPCPAHTIPDRLGARPGHATAHPRLVSGAPSCGEERPVNRPPGRDQGPPDHGGSTLQHRGPQPVPHHHHLLEHGSFGRSGRPSGSTPRCSSSPLSTALNRVPSRPDGETRRATLHIAPHGYGGGRPRGPAAGWRACVPVVWSADCRESRTGSSVCRCRGMRAVVRACANIRSYWSRL